MSRPGKLVPTAGLIAAAFAVFYSATASHTIILDARDAAELQTVGVAGGIPHQPYPLWCILARSASLVPLGEPAFRVTAVSILFSSLMVGLLCLLLFRRTGDYAASVCASIAVGLSYTLWQNSVIAEVYTLNAFLVVALLYLIDGIYQNSSWRHSLLLALVLGYLLSQHTINAAFLPAVATFLWASRRRLSGTQPAHSGIAHVLAFLLPFTLYYYTYLIDRGPYPMNWLNNIGKYYAEQQGISAEQFRRFVVRVWLQMWPGRLHPDMPSIGDLALNLRYWTKQILDAEFPLGGALLVAAGFITMWRRDARASVFLLLFAGFSLLLILTDIGGELYAHSIPIYVVCAIYIAAALAEIRRWKIAGRPIGRTLFVVAAAAIVVTPFLRHMKASPLSKFLRFRDHVEFVESAQGTFVHLRSSNDAGETYGSRVDEVVAPNSLIFARWSEANVLFYHKLVLGSLRDVEVGYLPPTMAQADAVVEERSPSRIYLTRLPAECGLDSFRVRETVNILPARALYPAQNLYVVDRVEPRK